MSLKDTIKTGILYYPNEDGLLKEQRKYMKLLYSFNKSKPNQQKKRSKIISELFTEVGKNCYIEPPLYVNWGCNVHFGNDVYANFSLTLVDDADIYVGDNVMFAPNVTVATASHPIDPVSRSKGAQFNDPVVICNNVWIGSGAIILPGVTIGENSVIGAGSVVTKDIPPNVVAVGNPCRVLREINDNDRLYYKKDKPINL